MKMPYGFIEGAPPRDGKTRIGYALVWHREHEDHKFRLHPECDGKTPVPVYFIGSPNFDCVGVGVQLTDGHIGWNWTELMYHPAPVEQPMVKNHSFGQGRWDSLLEEILSQELQNA